MEERIRVMELLAGIVMIVVLTIVAVAIVLKTSLVLVLGVALPLAWLWMVVDAFLRKPEEYPSRDMAEKIVWIVAMLLVQVVAVVYFFVVYRPLKRNTSAAVPPADAQTPGTLVAVAPPAAPSQP